MNLILVNFHNYILMSELSEKLSAVNNISMRRRI